MIAVLHEQLAAAASRLAVPNDSPEQRLINRLSDRLDALDQTTYPNDAAETKAVDLVTAHTDVFTQLYLPLALTIRASSVTNKAIIDALTGIGGRLTDPAAAGDAATDRTNLTAEVATLKAQWIANATAVINAAVEATKPTATGFGTADQASLDALTAIGALAADRSVRSRTATGTGPGGPRWTTPHRLERSTGGICPFARGRRGAGGQSTGAA